MRNFLFFAVLALVCVSGWASILSTETGGNWNDPATWAGGNVPTAYDDVVINGPVIACDGQDCVCRDLTVNAERFLYGGNTGGSEYYLYVYGHLSNSGTIRNHPNNWLLRLRCFGDISNAGLFTPEVLHLDGSADQFLCGSGSFSPLFLKDLAPASPVRLLSDLNMANSRIDLNHGILDLNYLAAGYTLSLAGGYIIQGNIHGGDGATLALSGGADLDQLTIDECVFTGTVEIANQVTVGILSNQALIQSANADAPVLIVTELLANHGTIRNNPLNWDLWLYLGGDLEHYGTLSNKWTVLNNTQPASLWQDATADPISCANVIAEAGSAPHELRSDLRFAGGNTNLNGATLILHSGRGVHGITFTNGFFGDAILQTDGFSPLTGSGVSLYSIQAEDLSFHGTVGLSGNCSVEDLVNYGYIEPRTHPVELTINGQLINYGTIRLINNWTLNLYCRGNISNYGGINNRNVYLDGTADQYLFNAGGISVSSFQLVSELGPAQWFFNGSLYNADVLLNRIINPNTLGVWQPVSGTNFGRLITIGSGVTELATPANFQALLLGTEPKLQWDQVPGAIYYKVYAGSDPCALFPDGWEAPVKAHDPDPADGIVRLDLTGTETFKFYRVTAGNTLP